MSVASDWVSKVLLRESAQGWAESGFPRWVNWPLPSPFKLLIQRFTVSLKKVRVDVVVFLIGVCSTWNMRYVERWQRYQQVLKQRNAALKARQARAAVAAWDVELVRLGDYLNAARARYVSLLSGSASVIANSLLGMDLGLSYRSGWNRDQSFSEALAASWPQRSRNGNYPGGTAARGNRDSPEWHRL
jgi:hypothetical protein